MTRCNHTHDARRRRLLIAGAAAAACAPLGAFAQGGISNRPVKFLLAQTTATTPDVMARLLAPRFQARWNQPFIVENRPGAAGAIGMEALAKAAPDGHTIQIMPTSILTLPLFFQNLAFDILGFSPISMVGTSNFALVVHSSVPANNVREFITHVRGTPGMNYASPGNGTYHHLFMEQLKLSTGIEIMHIPYKGSAPAFNDVLGGQVAAMFMPIHVGMAMSKDGRVRVLGGSMRERSPLFPDLPSIAEQGVADFNGDSWFCLWGPPGMPPDIVAKYNAELRSLLNEPDIREVFGKNGVVVKTGTPEELGRALRAEYDALAALVRAAKIKGD